MALPASPARSGTIARIPSLDGLRALSIFLVMALHTIQRFSLEHPVSLVWFGLFDGGTGVYIFFVISGYLITKLLLNEHQKYGAISLKGFYLRRALRILPPLYAYVIVIAALAWAGRVAMEKLDVISALFFFHNYYRGPNWQFEHFWSLSVEEQFYLMWPLILFYCLRRPGLPGRLLASRIALGVILAEPFIRILSYLSHNPYIHNGAGFHTRADALMFGCVAALLEGTPGFEHIYRLATKRWWIPPAVILISDEIAARFQNYWSWPLGFTVCGCAIGFFLLWCVRNPSSPAGRLLNSRFVVHIGVLSYSMYLWQTLFLHEDNAAIFGPRLKFLGSFPFNWIAILIVAELSRRLVELPALHLRDRLIGRFHLYPNKSGIKQST